MSTEASGCRTKGWARIPTLGVVEVAAGRNGKYDNPLAVKHPSWELAAIGPKRYQATSMILREIGHYSVDRKIYSRGTADGECGSMTGGGNGEWKTMRIHEWALVLNVGILAHVFVSPFWIFAIPMQIKRAPEERMGLRIGTSGGVLRRSI